MLRSWFVEDANRLSFELAELDALEQPYTIDDEFSKQGVLVVHTTAAIQGLTVDLRLVYPPGFPDVAPVVTADGLEMERHRTPLVGALCVPSAQANWLPHMSGASLIVEARELVEATLTDPARLHRDEIPAPEPPSFYFTYHEGAAMVVPEALQDFEFFRDGHGVFEVLALPSGQPSLVARARRTDADKTSVLEADEYLVRTWEALGAKRWRGVWVGLDVHTPYGAVGDLDMRSQFGRFRATLNSQNGDLSKWLRVESRAEMQIAGLPDLRANLVAAVYPDEAASRGRFIAGWLTALVHLKTDAFRFYRPLYWPAKDELTGDRRLVPLHSRRAVIVGAGTLGSTVALELAKAGIQQLTIVDPDHLSAANLSRHECEITELGMRKPTALARRIQLHAPWTKVTPIHWAVGVADVLDPVQGIKRYAELVESISDADLIVDTTGDSQATMLLNTLALRSNVPLVVGWASAGAWGGRLIRVRPRLSACYECIGWHLDVVKDSPNPPSDPEGFRFREGCAHPSFSGGGFDTRTVALAVARFAISTILASENYPDFARDHYVLAIQDKFSQLGLVWTPVDTRRMKRCISCGSASSATSITSAIAETFAETA